VVVEPSGLRVSRAGFGTGSLHHVASARGRRALLSAAADLGFTHFDTAPLYGAGLAERELGRHFGATSAVTIATKFGLTSPFGRDLPAAFVAPSRLLARAIPGFANPRVDFSVAAAERSLTQSLRALRRERVDLLLIHEPDRALIDEDALAEWLRTERQRGRIGAWGIAGEAVACDPFVVERSPLAAIVQARATSTAFAAWPAAPQFTYGHLQAVPAQTPAHDAAARIVAQMGRGVAIVTSRSVVRLRALVQAFVAQDAVQDVA
jgi:aryl-alcohol dehydrogenase-like predicted oxidoreductase